MLNRFKRILIFAAAIIFAVASVRANSDSFEKQTTLSAAEILSQETFQKLAVSEEGTYTIDDEVTVEGFLYHFTVRSPFGDYDVLSLWLLHQRIAELKVLKALEEFTDSRVFSEAVGQAGLDIATSPGRVVASLADAVTNPSKTMKTVRDIPEGLEGLFFDIADRVEAGAKSVKNFVVGRASPSPSGSPLSSAAPSSSASPLPSPLPSQDPSERAKAASALQRQGTKEALRYIGYNSKESEWYKKFELDPYTTNKPLRDKISRISALQTATNFGFKFVPGVGIIGLGAFGTANTILSDAGRIAVYADPKKQRDYNENLLQSMKIPPKEAQLFLSHPELSSTVRTLYLEALKKLDLPGRPYLVTLINRANSEEEGIFYLRSVRAIADLMASKVPAISVVRNSKIPGVIIKGKNVYLFLALDRVTWNEKFAGWVNSLLKQKASNQKKLKLFVSGTISDTAKAELSSRSIDFQEWVPMLVGKY